MDRITQTLIIGNNQKINYLIDAEFGSEAKKKFNTITFSFDQALSHFSKLGLKNNLENSRIIVLLQTEDIQETIKFLDNYRSKTFPKNNIFIMAVESKPLDASKKKELENKGVYCFVSFPIPVHALEYMVPEKTNNEEEVSEEQEEDNSHFFSYGGFMNLVY